MNEIIPRYEFRAFAQNFGQIIPHIRQRSPCLNMRESDEIYVISTATNENNTKVRDGVMDVKVLVQEEEGLEQWHPQLKAEFPLSAEQLQQNIFPAFGVEPPSFERKSYDLDQFVAELIRPYPELTPVRVFKRRFSFSINDCITEHAALLINGAAIQTIAVESEAIKAVLQAKSILNLESYENINYLRAIKRVIGLEPVPDEWMAV